MQNKQLTLIKKTIIIIILFILSPITLTISWGLSSEDYYITVILLIIYSVASFLLSFENRKPQAREIIIIGVLCLIAATSRMFFQVLPFMSPLAGFVIISAVAMGPHAGFIVGTISVLVSNITCGQGPWTPWQMFAFGIIGFIVGGIYQSKIIPKNKIVLSVVAFFAVLVVVGPLLDLSGFFTGAGESGFNFTIYLKALSSALMVNLIHSLTVTVTVFFLTEPMLSKLGRIRKKYGLMEVGA